MEDYIPETDNGKGKQISREDINRAVALFIKNGGKIKKITNNVSEIRLKAGYSSHRIQVL